MILTVDGIQSRPRSPYYLPLYQFIDLADEGGAEWHYRPEAEIVEQAWLKDGMVLTTSGNLLEVQ